MKALKLIICSGALLFIFSIQNGQGTLMLGTMMLAAKTGLMLGKMGVGGMMMMLLASQQNHDGSYGAYGKKRATRSVREGIDKDGKLGVNETEKEALLTERMVRQIDSTFDSLTCIPKFVCSMNAEPISKKTSLVNDYGHLLKIIFSQDGDDDDEDSVRPKKTKKKASKGKQGDIAGSQDDDSPEVDDMVNEELLEEDPALLPYILKDVVKKGGMKPHNDDGYDDDELSPIMPDYSLPPPTRQQAAGLSSYLPKLEAGLGTKIKDSDFDSDPFFDGFRSLKSLFGNSQLADLPLLDLSDDKDSQKVMTRRERMGFIRRKAKELEKSDDPVARYRIAAEVGRRTRNKNDCSKVFKKCPYKWEEVTGVVNNLKNTITNHPALTGKPAPTENKVIYLKTSSGAGENLSQMSVVQAAQGQQDGTTVFHDLGNGNLMEVSMKLVPMTVVPVKTPQIENLASKNPVPTEPPTAFAPELTEKDLDAAALAFQQANVNKTAASFSAAKKRYHSTNAQKLPILKEEIAAPPYIPTDDDELEDAYPVMLSISNKKEFQERPKKPISEEADDEEDDDDEDENEDEDEDDDARKEPLSDDAASAAFSRRNAPLVFSMRPYPILQGRLGYAG